MLTSFMTQSKATDWTKAQQSTESYGSPRPLKQCTGKAACYSECDWEGMIHLLSYDLFSIFDGYTRNTHQGSIVSTVLCTLFKGGKHSWLWAVRRKFSVCIDTVLIQHIPLQQTARIIWGMWQMKAWCFPYLGRCFPSDTIPVVCSNSCELKVDLQEKPDMSLSLWQLKALEETCWEYEHPLQSQLSTRTKGQRWANQLPITAYMT